MVADPDEGLFSILKLCRMFRIFRIAKVSRPGLFNRRFIDIILTSGLFPVSRIIVWLKQRALIDTMRTWESWFGQFWPQLGNCVLCSPFSGAEIYGPFTSSILVYPDRNCGSLLSSLSIIIFSSGWFLIGNISLFLRPLIGQILNETLQSCLSCWESNK